MKALDKIVQKHYVQITDLSKLKDIGGAQMWNGEWWMPLEGCDTLSNLIDDIEFFINITCLL